MIFLMYLAKATSPIFPHASHDSSNPRVIDDQALNGQWGPEAVSNIVFGCIMVLIGSLGLWQGRLYHNREYIIDPSLLSDLLHLLM